MGELRATRVKTHVICCPHCGGELGQVIDSRPCIILSNPSVRRRRVCDTCSKRSNTYEISEAALISVRKRQAIIKDIMARLADAFSKSDTVEVPTDEL